MRQWGLIMDLQEMEWKKNPFYFDRSHPFTDFNKEIIRPKQHFECRRGGVIIRADENFWQVAFLPYKFHKLPIEDIVQTLWPEKWEQAEFGEDVEYAANAEPKTEAASKSAISCHNQKDR